MHLVKRSDCPELLTTNKDKWTTPWVVYYTRESFFGPRIKQLSKPIDGHWRKEEIRAVLISDFNKNCGYCGSLIPTPIIDDNDKVAGKGDVDHFLAKAIYPHLTYEWSNYIWSCKPCNQLKGEFDDVEYPLFDPCLITDCQNLNFIEDTGQYTLYSNVSEETVWKNRFKNHETQTLINCIDIQKKRKNLITLLRGRFTSISNGLKTCVRLSPLEHTYKEILDTITSIKVQNDADKTEIKENLLSHPEFKLLIKAKYELLRQEYPDVSVFIDKS